MSWFSAARAWAGMSSGPSSSCSQGRDSGTRSDMKRVRSRSTAGSAFSWMTRLAEVCCTNTEHRPVVTRLRRRRPRTPPRLCSTRLGRARPNFERFLVQCHGLHWYAIIFAFYARARSDETTVG